MPITKIISPKDKKIITLVGMMGAGKSTVGLRLAKKLGIKFIDSDKEIERKEKKSINEIFRDHSQEYFRQIEEKVICEIIANNDPVVLSLGGGALTNDEISKAVKGNTVSIWLNANLEVLLERIGNKTNRPLLNNVDKREVLSRLIQERTPKYKKCDLEIDSSNKNHEQTVNHILEELQKII